jgi:hypothetical protein
LSTAALSTPTKQRYYLARTEKLWLGVVALVYLVVGIRGAWLHPFVFHEFSTLFVSSTPTIGTMFRAIPTDGNPPLYFVLARLCLMLPIKAELALRLPAMAAYFGAALTVYWFVRRNTAPIFALLAMCVFLGSPISLYTIDARPYPLLLFFTGLSLCFWQSHCRSGSRAALAGIALSVAGGICSHQYGLVYTLGPLFAGEGIRSLKRKKYDPAVWASGGVGALTVFLTFPPMLRGQQPLLDAIAACPAFAARPHISDLKLYASLLPPLIPGLVILGVVLFALRVALLPKEDAPGPPRFIPSADWEAAIMTTLLLPVILLATRLGTNYFQARYGLGSGLGVAMLSGMLMARLRWRYAVSLAWAAAVYSVAAGLLGLWFAARPPGVPAWNDPTLRAGNANEPIVVANATEFSRLWWYSDGGMRARLHYLTDLSYAGQQSGLVPEYSLMLERAYLPMPLDDYRTWLAGRRDFLLYCSGDAQFEWIKQRLIDDGWRLTLLQSAPAVKARGAKAEGYREMYEVSR